MLQTSQSSVKAASQEAREKALYGKAVAASTKRILKDVVEFLERNPSQASPCLLGLRSGMFEVEAGGAGDKDIIAATADYIRLLPLSVIRPLLIDMAGLSHDEIASAQKLDKKSYIKIFCMVFGENPSKMIPSRNKDCLNQIYKEWHTVLGSRKPTFKDDGTVDWTKGVYILQKDEENPDDDKFAKILHISGKTVPPPSTMV
jgi:hypothetical protein